MIDLEEKDGGVSFRARVTPRSHRDAFDGEFSGALKIRLKAPPVDDRANSSLCRFLASRLNVPLAAVRILSGRSGRTKLIRVAGISRASALSALTEDSPLNNS